MTLASRMTDFAAAVRDKFNAIAPRLIPTGGADGQFLQKTGVASYGWSDPGGGGGAPGGADRRVQYNAAGAFAGASGVMVGADGHLHLVPVADTPPAPPAGQLQLYARDRVGTLFLEMQRPSGRDLPFQPHLGVNAVSMWTPSSGTAVNLLNSSRSATGTVSTPTPDATNLKNQTYRYRMSSAATANATCDERSATLRCWRGNAPGLGGFTFNARFGLTTLQPLSSAFFGLLSGTGTQSGSATPGSLINCIGVGLTNGTHTTWQITHNDASGAGTLVDTGIPFNTTSLLTLWMFCPANADSIFLRLVDESTGQAFDYEATTNIPANTVFLGKRLYMNNGGAAAACAYDASRVYIETDF